ncbi:hypothetical protein EYF80_050772 [Liparis tanakae]|uniref:Uncharacterized protein n=1 Tax=Liparis tanakae TaxID=230148 RepID=A0A4Z2FCV1_9TELE|nr:hypothetical protein EYF80_050772 [Liparis tanakae]
MAPPPCGQISTLFFRKLNRSLLDVDTFSKSDPGHRKQKEGPFTAGRKSLTAWAPSRKEDIDLHQPLSFPRHADVLITFHTATRSSSYGRNSREGRSWKC